jgi:hypothetical protein
MKPIREIKALQQQNENEVRQLKNQAEKIHAALVTGSRERKQDDLLNGLVSEEATLWARVETLQQIRAGLDVELKAAEADAASKEAQDRAKVIRELGKDLAAAAREAEKQSSILKKIVYDAIDTKHAELRRVVNIERNLTPQEVNKITQDNEAVRYLYELYIYFKRVDQAREYVLAGLDLPR